MFVLDSGNSAPLYWQLYNQCKDKILNGELKTGVKVPSSRKLSYDLGVSRNTVEVAYAQLYSEGYLVSKPRSGYYVESLDTAVRSGGRLAVQQETDYEEPSPKTILYDFRYGRLHPQDMPAAQWQKLMNRCFREYREQLGYYGQPFGEPGLKQEIEKYLLTYRGVNCHNRQILIGAGTQYFLGIICQLLALQSSGIAMEEPGYFGARTIFENLGLKTFPVGLDQHGINIEQLEATGAKAVYITPSHQFPTGIVMPVLRRLQLIEWAVRNDAIIIEDDYSCHLRYNVKPIQSLQSLANDRVIYLGCCAKFLFPSIRLSYMVLPENFSSMFQKKFSGFASSVPFIIQKTAEMFMREGYWDSYLRKTVRQQKKKHDLLVRSLKREFGERLLLSGMHAGLHLLLQTAWPVSEDELITRAEQAGVKVYSATRHWAIPCNDGYGRILLGYGGLKPEDIAQAVSLLRQSWLSSDP